MKQNSFTFRDPAAKQEEAWRVSLEGQILPASWNSKGAAEAGLQTEMHRKAKKAEVKP